MSWAVAAPAIAAFLALVWAVKLQTHRDDVFRPIVTHEQRVGQIVDRVTLLRNRAALHRERLDAIFEEMAEIYMIQPNSDAEDYLMMVVYDGADHYLLLEKLMERDCDE